MHNNSQVVYDSQQNYSNNNKFLCFNNIQTATDTV